MENSLSEDSVLLIEKLIELGGRSNNVVLRTKIGWSQEKYFAVRNQCRAAGLLGLARGRNGIVILTDVAQAALPAPAEGAGAAEPAAVEEVAREAEYYESLKETITRDWVASEGYDSALVEITASKRVKGAGRWTVPDIVVIGKTVYQYAPGFEFTVQSLEIKRFEALDATAVFEALNHRRASHYTYLVIVNHPKKPSSADQEKMGQVQQLCREHDVGLVVINKNDEKNYDNWDFQIEAAERYEPELYNLDGFVKQYLSSEGRDAVSKMVR